VSCGGLLAPALKDSCDRKIGIWGVDVRSGARRILARIDKTLGGPSIGPYSFDQEAMAWAVAVVEKALGRCQLLVVDEIGKLELQHGTGLAPILPRLAAGEAERALILVRESLLADLQAKLGPGDPITFEISAETRGTLAPRVLEALMDELGLQQKEIAKWQT
jgi:nucleoside-triphosphatase THEP1